MKFQIKNGIVIAIHKKMKSKLHISILILGIIVAVLCVFITNSNKLKNGHNAYLSYNFDTEDTFIFNIISPKNRNK